MVYHQEKFEDKTDLVIDVLGANHSGHVPRLKAAINSLGFDVNRFKVILYELVRIKRGSISNTTNIQMGEADDPATGLRPKRRGSRPECDPVRFKFLKCKEFKREKSNGM